MLGMTALMFCSQLDSPECTREMLYAGADVNAVEEDGWAALHFAAKDGHLKTCRLLLRSRADAGIRSDEGTTALEMAQAEDHSFAAELAKLMQETEALFTSGFELNPQELEPEIESVGVPPAVALLKGASHGHLKR